MFNLTPAAWMSSIELAGHARSATLGCRVASCVSAAGILLLGAVGCAATALWILVLPTLGPIGAAMIVAATLVALALILAAVGWYVVSHRSRKRDGAALPPALLDDAIRLFTEHKGALLLAALLTGIAAANTSRRS
jgi:hypothetical protein